MEKYIIKENDSGQRLDKFIFKIAPKVPKSLLFKTIRKKDIKLNGKKTEGSVILRKDDIVEIYLHSKFFTENNTSFLDSPADLNVIYEDPNIIVVNKPIGLLMHQGKEISKDNITNRLLHYLYNKNEYNPDKELSFAPAFCNRLDRNTNGLVVAAKNFETLQLLNQKMKNREIIRKYLCIVKGVMPSSEATIISYHCKDTTNNKALLSNIPKEGFSKSETRYKVIENFGNTSLVEAELITGYFHQIRAHMASIGNPILGDNKYGENHSKQKSQKLTSYYIGFDFKDKDRLSYLNGKTIKLDINDCF